MRFEREMKTYRESDRVKGFLTYKQRRALFDSLEHIGSVTAEDRLGGRLRKEGFPEKDEYYFDVDLWHPGSQEELPEARKQLDIIIDGTGARRTDFREVAGTLLLARIYGTDETVKSILEYDRVARVDLPPILPQPEFTIFDQVHSPSEPFDISEDMPLACVVDSGVVSGHPLLRGLIVGYNNIESGEPTEVDQVGHGTHVAGIVAYGDVHSCLQSNQWIPLVRLLNAKVMRRGQDNQAEFADENRVETQVTKAIEWGIKEHGCRIFNLSLGNSDLPFYGGRQLPWALALDELALKYDVVIVVSAGNVTNPLIPSVNTTEEFQRNILGNLTTKKHALIDPACAANVITVGSLARTDSPSEAVALRYPGDRTPLVGSPPDCPSPFTRTGHYQDKGNGIHRMVKPEVVAYGGNYCLDPVKGQRWVKNEPNLGEPSLAHDYATTGRLLKAASGTSFSAPYVTHVAALVENSLQLGLYEGRSFSSNLIRALVVHSANVGDSAIDWISAGLSDPDAESAKLRTVGFGKPSVDKAVFSSDNRVVLIADDEILENHIHLYELEIPEAFILESGDRFIRATLAYDPPVRGTRKEYLSRTMWFELYRGLPAESIIEAMSKTTDGSRPPKLPSVNKAKSRPPHSQLTWSTVQSTVFAGKRKEKFNYRPFGPNTPATFHILVGCTKRFESELSEIQRYSIVVSLEHSNEEVKIYNEVRQRISQRVRIRT